MFRSLFVVPGFVLALACAPAWGADDLVVGQVAPLTGVNASNGVPVMQGARLYFDYLNASGGIHGRKVRFTVRDDAYKVDETVRQARELIDKDGALLLLTTLGTANNEALEREKVLGNAGIAMVGPRSGASSLYGIPNVFPIRASYHDETRKIVRQLTTIGVSRIGVVMQNDSFGEDALEGIQLAMRDNLLELTAESRFDRGSARMDKAVNDMLKADPQAIVLLAVTDPAVSFIKAYRARGGNSRIFCLSIVDPDSVVRGAGAEQARGVAMTVVVPSPGRVSLPLLREMHRAATQLKIKDFKPTLNSIEGYITAKVAAEALRRSGPRPDRATVLRVLGTMPGVDVGGFTARIRPNPNEDRYVDLAVIGPGGQLLQ